MRIAMVAVGTHGDIQPGLVLARGLKAAGHTVRFVTSIYYHELVRAAGLEPIDLNSPDPRSTMASVQAQTVAASPLRRYLRILQPTGTPTDQQKNRMVETCRGVDLILSNYGLFYHAAAHLRIAYIGFGVTPIHATRAFPHPLSRCRRSLGGWVNLATHHAVHGLFWSRERRWVNEWRHRLGLAPENLLTVRRRIAETPFLYGISPSVIPLPSDWPKKVRMTGYWFPSDAPDWQPSPDLIQFLGAGPPPVAVGFGSLIEPDPAGLRQILSAALRAAGVRGLILGDWSPPTVGDTGDQIFSTSWVPFAWLMSRVSALVHHAGSGTCAQALLAGVPSVCIAFSGEQWFWAGRLQSLQVSASRVRRRLLNSTDLAKAIRRAHDDPALRAATTRVAARIAREDGVKQAVAAIEELAPAAKQSAQ